MKANVTISRDSSDRVNIRIKDSATRIQFVELSLSVEDYGYLISGLSEIECEMKVRGLANVGKRMVTEPRATVCPVKSYSRDVLQQWLLDYAQEDGWTLDTYLGSQGSITHKDDGVLLRYRVYKYVQEEQ
jgi:hypothetical protein